MRAKRFALFALLIAVFVAVVLLIPKLIFRHPYVNTTGEIVFASDRGTPGHSHLFLAHADSGAIRQITSGRENDTQPAFSHDGSQITFVSDRTGTPQVYVMDAGGRSQRAISFGTDQKLLPQFSSDGQSVGYISRGQLIVANVIGGHTGIVFADNFQCFGGEHSHFVGGDTLSGGFVRLVAVHKRGGRRQDCCRAADPGRRFASGLDCGRLGRYRRSEGVGRRDAGKRRLVARRQADCRSASGCVWL